MKIKSDFKKEDLEISRQGNPPLHPSQEGISSVITTNYKLQTTNELSPKQFDFAIAAAKLTNKFIEHASQAKYKKQKVHVQKKFADAYNNGAMPEIFKVIGSRSVKTLRTWQTKYLKSGKDFRVLAPDYRIKKASSVTPQESEVLVKLFLNPNQPPYSEVIRQAQNIFEAKRFPFVKSYNTYKRFLEDWQKENYADYVFYREGEKGLDDKVLPYLERDWDLVETGDILIMDGHVNNYEIINPFTGKPKRMMTIGAIDGHSQFLCGYEIAPTENVLAIASTLRRAILNSRKIPKIVYIDNGKAFLAKYFCSEDLDMLESLFNRLGIRTIIAKKYHAQSKPIEPFWDWMGEVERLMPTYVGSSIEMQPPRLNRGEFLHRKLYDKAMQHTTIDIFTAHAAMAWWLDQYHNREKTDGHLKGLTPAEAFNRGQETEVRSQKSEGSILMPDRKTLISKAELNYLMMDLHITKLYRKGIRMFSRWYWNKELFGKQIDAGDEVHVKYDLFDRDSILVYDREGNLVCEAFDVAKVHPAARLLGTSEDQEELKRQLALKEKLKTSVVGPAREFLQEEIYPFVKKQLRDAKILQLETPDEDSPSSGSPHLEEGAGVKKKGGKRRSLIDRWAMPPDRKNSNIDLIPKTGEGSR